MEDKTGHQEGGKGLQSVCAYVCICVCVRACVGGWIIIPSVVVKQSPSLCRKILSSANLHHLETLTQTHTHFLASPVSLPLLPCFLMESCKSLEFSFASPLTLPAIMWPLSVTSQHLLPLATPLLNQITHRPSEVDYSKLTQTQILYSIMHNMADANWCWRLMDRWFP